MNEKPEEGEARIRRNKAKGKPGEGETRRIRIQEKNKPKEEATKRTRNQEEKNQWNDIRRILRDYSLFIQYTHQICSTLLEYK